jgi:hypothetical protein
VLVKTTSLATVAAPTLIDGSLFCQSTLPVPASIAVRPPVPVLKLPRPPAMPVALACVGKLSQGTKRRLPANAIGVSTPPKMPGKTSIGLRGSRPVSC